MPRITATRASTAALLELMTASLLAVVLLGERLTAEDGGGVVYSLLLWPFYCGREGEKRGKPMEGDRLQQGDMGITSV
ncbi:hypothetical protein [Salinithrix halophila]|uniref:EamA-like transporter family protein n=1 Tax=Salinithrix halophila TaxID=1485204 RepID=A0ABV8JFA3_9BACL